MRPVEVPVLDSSPPPPAPLGRPTTVGMPGRATRYREVESAQLAACGFKDVATRPTRGCRNDIAAQVMVGRSLPSYSEEIMKSW